MNRRIVIIGAGEIGIAVGRILKTKDYQIELWDKDPSVLSALGGEAKGLPGIVPEADAIFMCVPSWALREALLFVSPYLSKHTVVVGISKGIEANSLKTTDELLSSLLPKKQPYCLLSGPMISEELREDRVGAGVIASEQAKAISLIEELFSGTNVITAQSSDLRGVALCGVLKNIYSLAFGVCFGLDLGDNAKGIILVAAISEMKKILSVLGGKQETALGYAGLGDLIATGLSSNSKNHEAGRELALGRVNNMKTEGMISLSSMAILLGEKYKKFPLFSAMHNILSGKQDARLAFAKLFVPMK